MEDIKAIDVMNYLSNPKPPKTGEVPEEFTILARTIFKMDTVPVSSAAGLSAAEVVAEMDEAGYEKIFISATKMWSYRNNYLIMDYGMEEVYEQTRQFPDRIIGLAGYHPFRITESLRDVEKGVKELGFKGVYCHTLGHNVRPNDRRMYPLYAKCVELDVPVSMQIGHSLELMPSEPGRPIYIDEVALDFPKLRFIASHTGWPWCEELIAMGWKHENVYIDISAHMPKYLDASLVKFMNTRGRDKVLFGTNGITMKDYKEQFLSLPLKDETKVKVLRENAIKVFKL